MSLSKKKDKKIKINIAGGVRGVRRPSVEHLCLCHGAPPAVRTGSWPLYLGVICPYMATICPYIGKLCPNVSVMARCQLLEQVRIRCAYVRGCDFFFLACNYVWVTIKCAYFSIMSQYVHTYFLTYYMVTHTYLQAKKKKKYVWT